MLKRRLSRTGFTLIELMIVISIIAILAAILVPNFIRARSRSQLVSCSSNLKAVGTALEMYNVDSAGRYPASLDALTPNYLKVIPDCPVAGSDTYSGSYVTGIPDTYVVFCEGSFHGEIVPTDYPQFDAEEGLIER